MPLDPGHYVTLDIFALLQVNKFNNVPYFPWHSGREVSLFNPRQERWQKHFRWDGVFVVGGVVARIGESAIIC